MKGLFLVLLPHCLNSLHICPTFPYCALQPSGLWSSLPLLFKPPVNVLPVLRVTPEPTPRSSTSCWFPDTYCRPSPSNLVDTGEATTAADCQEECDNTEGCSFFTFLRHRGSPQCSLLSSCTRANRCSVGESCASGPPRCSCNRLDRSLQSREEGVRYAFWECDGDINPYDSDIPSGTKCTTTCPAWRGLEDDPLVLESTCVEGNQWTSTRPTLVPSAKPTFRPIVSPTPRPTGPPRPTPTSTQGPPLTRVLPYATTIYNTPDMEDMVCGCQNVGPFDYNPNNEDLAELVCRGGEPKDFDAPKGWNFTTTDRCDLFCNQEPVVSVYCDGTSWVGEPEKGIWCYTSPENPGPRNEDSTGPGTESDISDEEAVTEEYDGVQTYGELPSGELCSYGRGIKSEQECREAAKTLQMEFAQSWTGSGDFPGCLIANDGRNKVYFNLSPTPSTTANNPAYGAICITTADCTFVRGEACDGNAIMDVDLDQDDCIDSCKSVVDCNCVTWIHNAGDAKCRLETGTTASDRGSSFFSAVTMTKCNVAP